MPKLVPRMESFAPSALLAADDAKPGRATDASVPAVPPPRLAFGDDKAGIFLYQGDCLLLLDRIIERHPDGIFDAIFADPLTS